MHGVVFTSLKKYTEQKLGKPQWSQILQEAALEYRLYLAGSDYPEEEAFALLQLIARNMKMPEEDIQEDFGRFSRSRCSASTGVWSDQSGVRLTC